MLYLLYGANKEIADDRGGRLTELSAKGRYTRKKILLKYLYFVADVVVLPLRLRLLEHTLQARVQVG